MRRTRSTRGVTPRLAAPAATAAVLLLGACGGGGDGAALFDEERAEQDQPSEEDAGQDRPEAAPGDFEGFWSAGGGASGSVLFIDSGSAAFTAGSGSDSPTFCVGTLDGAALTLECQDGSTEWSEATLTPGDSRLQVAWASGAEETYESVTDLADLENLPDLSELPEIPGLEELPNLDELPDLSELFPELPDTGELEQRLPDPGDDLDL